MSAEELKGEELKNHLINFRSDLIELNNDNDRVVMKLKNYVYEYQGFNKENEIKQFETYKNRNLNLIEIIENQLQRDFCISKESFK